MSVERHDEDVRALGPLGVFYTNELPAADLRFRQALEQLERNFAEPARKDLRKSAIYWINT